jgi:uncharacterized protein (DUF433 family)
MKLLSRPNTTPQHADGMRITVSLIVGQIAHGATADEILKEYLDLEREDIREAMEYAAWVVSEEVHPAPVD